mgnify:CR=1 FL=1
MKQNSFRIKATSSTRKEWRAPTSCQSSRRSLKPMSCPKTKWLPSLCLRSMLRARSKNSFQHWLSASRARRKVNFGLPCQTKKNSPTTLLPRETLSVSTEKCSSSERKAGLPTKMVLKAQISNENWQETTKRKPLKQKLRKLISKL